LTIIGDPGIVNIGVKRYLETISGKHSVESLPKKKAILGISQIRKVLQFEI